MKSCCVAVFVPDPDAMQAYVAAMPGVDANKLIAEQDQALKDKIMSEVNRLAGVHNLNGLEKPKDFWLTAEAFTPENGILTATAKMKRSAAKKHFQDKIDTMYHNLSSIERKY